MPNYSKTILVGHLTRDVELKFTPNQTAVASCGIAVTHKYKEREDTMFIDFDVWGKQAETFNKYCKKGQAIMLEGRLVYQTWEKDGQKRSKHKLSVDSFQFLGAPQGKPEKIEPGPDDHESEYQAPVDSSDIPF
jgi:single-strand DNA-binding protein